MKKRIVFHLISLVLILSVVCGLTSCADPSEKLNDAGKDQETTDAQTTAEQTPDEDTADLGTTDETDKTQPEETEPKEILSINTDLFNEYMMTYGELSEKHGELIGYERFDGGNFYLFENGYGYYFFYLPETPFEWVTDPDTGLKYRKIDEGEICRGVRNIEFDQLFNIPVEALSIEEISNIEGINYVRTTEGDLIPGFRYGSTFTYEGWNNDKVVLQFTHKDKDMIDLTSETRIYIHPLNIDAETAD